jgi:hypothetical protein
MESTTLVVVVSKSGPQASRLRTPALAGGAREDFDSVFGKDNYEIHLAHSLTDITLYSAFGIALSTPPGPAT